MQIYATATAICREASYPQLQFKGWLSWLSPPPLGRVIFLACYWAVILFMMTNNAVVGDAYYWERIGFRNAWISVTQVPVVYLLASKSSLIGSVIGSSHERLNWLHRWVSRTLLVTVTVHGGFFMAEWVRSDFVNLEIELMPMVKYGMGAWAILVWTFLSSLSPLRRLAYEFFVLQHIAAAAVFLWLLYVHVPSYASYNVWLAIGFVSFDRVLRGYLLFYNNFRIRLAQSCNGTQRIGHQVELQAYSDITVITIKDAHLHWKPGQHLYLWLPRLGLLETHPFTIASPYRTPNKCHCNEIQLAIRAQSGFTKRVHQYAMRTQGSPDHALIAFIAGPYGVPPAWNAYETLILISASTGASFTLPILESILNFPGTACTQRISFLLIVRRKSHIEFYVQRLSDALTQAEKIGIELNVEIAVTGEEGSLHGSESSAGEEAKAESHQLQASDDADLNSDKHAGIQTYVAMTSQSSSSSTSSNYTPSSQGGGCCDCTNADEKPLLPSRGIMYSDSRPDIASFLRKPVEATGGETSVAVCAGKSLVATVRNSVARLSNERAVHKGTGAQGISLHVEEYCF